MIANSHIGNREDSANIEVKYSEEEDDLELEVVQVEAHHSGRSFL